MKKLSPKQERILFQVMKGKFLGFWILLQEEDLYHLKHYGWDEFDPSSVPHSFAHEALTAS